MYHLNSKETCWMISFGQIKPPQDDRRLVSILKDEDLAVRNEYDKCQGFFRSQSTKKIRRGMICCVKKGMNNNSEIFRILLNRGFAYIPRSGKNYSLTTLSQYMIYVRKELKIPVVEKQYAILELIKQGMTDEQIIKKLDTSRRYIQEVNKMFNLKKGKKNGKLKSV